MKKPILKWKTRNRVIIALALAYRFVYPPLIVLVSCLLGGTNLLLFLGIGCCLYGTYMIAGYKLRWKHIYCAYQVSHRGQKMTPDNIRWETIRNDIYIVPIIFGVIGIGCLVCHFLVVYA